MSSRATIAALAVWALPIQGVWAGEVQENHRLRDYLSRSLDTPNLQFRAAEADLDRDGTKEFIIYVTSPDFCGSGGCRTLVLKRLGRSYRTIVHATITRPPIRVLTTRHHGWNDIGVWVSGGGIIPGYEAALSFDGHRYPSNPSVPPARRLTQTVAGHVVIE